MSKINDLLLSIQKLERGIKTSFLRVILINSSKLNLKPKHECYVPPLKQTGIMLKERGCGSGMVGRVPIPIPFFFNSAKDPFLC